MESVEYEPAWAVGANCGNDNIASVAKMIDLANDYGMDAIEIGDVLATYMEATGKGYTNGDGGLAWGDYMSMIETMGKVAYRQGIGNVLADGDAVFTKATGLTLDLSGKGMGLRSNRYSMLVKDGKVTTLNIEAPGKFEVSDAATMLTQAKA